MKVKRLWGKYIAKIRGKEYVRTQDGKAIKQTQNLMQASSEEDVEIEVINAETGNVSNKYTVEGNKSSACKREI